jgi:dTDP-4-dehydrorhamnose 3,5-epimerase-like enzyme
MSATDPHQDPSHTEVRFVRIEDRGDARGALFRIPGELIELLGAVGDIHFGEIRPGATRGNHAHAGNAELILFQWNDRCQIAYDQGEGQPATILNLEGHGAAALYVPPLCAHAFRNTGTEVMGFTSLPSSSYDISDLIRRTLLP